ncbi:MAG: hypothetical protein EZS28_038142 [Streblomastix strix]|uniref:Uncharacterized protein n=1 Tax=Streblomastix strix TaxID=222440 RepID=A0A5J4U7Z0_9EUKA|nr:MAG: hypothetical protein EZS28_038142 [Streblomastix strix]
MFSEPSGQKQIVWKGCLKNTDLGPQGCCQVPAFLLQHISLERDLPQGHGQRVIGFWFYQKAPTLNPQPYYPCNIALGAVPAPNRADGSNVKASRPQKGFRGKGIGVNGGGGDVYRVYD